MRIILAVDDDPDILGNYPRILAYVPEVEVLTASSGADAVDLWDERQRNPELRDVDLVILDVKMPGMGGREVHSAIVDLCEIREIIGPAFIFVSGYPNPGLPGGGFIAKPFGARGLIAVVKAALEPMPGVGRSDQATERPSGA